MNEAEVLNRIKVVLAKMLKKQIQEITPESSLKEDMGIDSVDWLDMAFLIEDNFKIKIEDAEAMKFRKVADVVNLVCDKLGI